VVKPDDDLECIKKAAVEDVESVLSRIDRGGEGVCVQASTLGSLEALLEFLKTPEVNIPVSSINIGPVHKKDVMKASVMLEKKREYSTILAFDVKVTPEARELADELGVKIFIADIIYHLFDQFKAYMDNIKEEKKKESADEAVFPCVLKILPNCVFNKKDPIVLGVDILEGILKVSFLIMIFFQCGCNVCDDSCFLCIRLHCLSWGKFNSCILPLHVNLRNELAIVYFCPLDKFMLLLLKWGGENFTGT
jgi:translation initiation factor 5B